MTGGTKNVLDIAGLTAALGAVAKFLPPLAALFSIVWYSIRIYEWYKRKRNESHGK